MDHLLKQMQMFIEVAELKSFTKAAQRLGIPKGAVSIGISKLESHLDTRLLHRTTRNVQLTQDGVFFLEKSHEILHDVEEASLMFKQGEKQLRGRVKVDVPSRIARQVIIPNINSFYKKYPNINIELGSTDRRVDLIREGIDCVIRVGELADSSLIVRRIGDLKIVNCASSDYLKKYGTPKTVKDLKNHYLVNYFSDSYSYVESKPVFEYQENNKNQSIEMRSLISVNNAETYIAAAQNGLGIIQVPEYDVVSLLKSKKLKRVLEKDSQKSMSISFLYPHRRHLSQKVQIFMEWASKLMKEVI